MKYFVAVLALVSLLSTTSCDEKMKDARIKMIKDCQEKTGASEADIDALRSGKRPETKEGVCMYECLFTEAKVMQDGKYNEEGLVKALTPLMGGDETKIGKLKEMASACGKEIASESGDKCDIAAKLMHCTVVKGKEFGFEYPKDF